MSDNTLKADILTIAEGMGDEADWGAILGCGEEEDPEIVGLVIQLEDTPEMTAGLHALMAAFLGESDSYGPAWRDEPMNPIEQGIYDDDPSPYDGTYSEGGDSY